MTDDPSYDELPQRLNGTFDYPVTPPADLVHRVVTEGRRARRRRRALLGVSSAATIALVAVAAPLTAAHLHAVRPSASLTALGTPPPVAPPISPTPSRPVPTATATSTPFPGHFLADIGAGHERQTVVLTAGGTGGRAVTPGSQALGVVSDDGTTLWEPVGVSLRWDAIDIATGATRPAPQYTGDRDFAISPTDATLATWDGSTLRVGSAALPTTRAPYPAWAADGRHLVIVGDTGIDVLDRALHTTLAVAAPPGCTYDAPHFVGDRTLAVGRTCSRAGTSAIAFISSVTGRQLGSATIVTGAPPRSLFGIGSMDVDTAGNIILTVITNSGSDGIVYTVSAGAEAVHRQGTVDAYQVSWLPRSD